MSNEDDTAGSSGGDYYTSLLERVDGAISTPNANDGGSMSITQNSTLQEQAQACMYSTGQNLMIAATWLHAHVLELYQMARSKYYERKRRSVGGENRNTPFSSLRHDMERRDSIEL
jgi:hypothetical protein